MYREWKGGDRSEHGVGPAQWFVVSSIRLEGGGGSCHPGCRKQGV